MTADWAAPLRPPRAGLEPDHQRDPPRQPRHARHLLEAALDDRGRRPPARSSVVGLGHREESQEARDRRLAAADLDLPGAQPVGEATPVPEHRRQRAGIGLDGRIGFRLLPARDLEPAAGYPGAKPLPVEAEPVASRPSAAAGSNVVISARPSSRCRASRRREGTARRCPSARGRGRPARGRDRGRSGHRPASCRMRRERVAPHDPVLLELAQALGEDVGAQWGRPTRRSVKRFGPSSSSRTTSSAHRSPTTSSARATPHWSPMSAALSWRRA